MTENNRHERMTIEQRCEHDRRFLNHYTHCELKRRGPFIAMGMLRGRVRTDRPFVTYKEIAEEITDVFNLDCNSRRDVNVNPRGIGHVAGSLVDIIHHYEPEAPLFNMLIVRTASSPSRRLPSVGVADYFDCRYGGLDRSWDRRNNRDRTRKRAWVLAELELIQNYRRWDQRLDELRAAQEMNVFPTCHPSDDCPNHGSSATVATG